MEDKIHLSHTVNITQSSVRLDQLLTEAFPKYSRARWQEWIKSGAISVNGAIIVKPNYKPKIDDLIDCQITIRSHCDWLPQALPLNIVYEDNDLIVLNKPAGSVVHPGSGHIENTLVNALLHHAPCLHKLPRGGIIHRLDKDTTGLMVVAKSLEAHTSLVSQLQARSIERCYIAIVFGELISGGTVDEPLGRHPKQRLKRAVLAGGKPAVTHYRIQQKFRGFTELSVSLETGRTHQIRVHLSYMGYPIVGDPLYGQRSKLAKGLSDTVRQTVLAFKRQALHAETLSFEHPVTQTWLKFQAPPPQDYIDLRNTLSSN